MTRRRLQDEHENTERWLVSYADFITLLFAFFVVMYSMSSVNEGKYRVLSDTMVDAFKTPPKSTEPIQIGEPVKSIKPEDGRIDKPQVIKLQPRHAAPDTAMQRIASDIKRAMQPLIDQGLIEVTQDKLWVTVEMNTSILFTSGSAALEDEAYPVLRDLSTVLAKLPNHVDVEGYTDNLPINNEIFRSNWELSAARAASVVHLFTRNDIDPERLAAIGYGEYRPVADNATSEGRRKNRRVAVVILADKNARRMLEIERKMDDPYTNNDGNGTKLESEQVSISQQQKTDTMIQKSERAQ
ncbi:MAG: flagellar motor protein MotD [Thioalkalispiraceae bacterium]|jgi:chemotaxis protein MotB